MSMIKVDQTPLISFFDQAIEEMRGLSVGQSFVFHKNDRQVIMQAAKALGINGVEEPAYGDDDKEVRFFVKSINAKNDKLQWAYEKLLPIMPCSRSVAIRFLHLKKEEMDELELRFGLQNTGRPKMYYPPAR